MNLKIIDELYKKRFILSREIDADINTESITTKFKNSKEFTEIEPKIYCCELTRFYHIACCFRNKITHKNNNPKMLSYGMNHYLPSMELTDTIHAEANAINKLPFSRKKQKINILVIRFTKCSKQLCMSRPCSSCIHMMNDIAPKKGYIIKNIYYSDMIGNISKTTLSKITT